MSADSGGPAYVFDNSSEDETIGVALLSAEEDDGDSGDGESNGGENNLEISAVHGLGKASSFSCTVNLANTVVGAGMLGLPHAFAEAGSFVGVLLLLVAGIASSLSLHLLAVCQQTVGKKPSSFYTIANAAFPALTSFIDVAVAIKCFGVATSYWRLDAESISRAPKIVMDMPWILVVVYASGIAGIDPCMGHDYYPPNDPPLVFELLWDDAISFISPSSNSASSISGAGTAAGGGGLTRLRHAGLDGGDGRDGDGEGDGLWGLGGADGGLNGGLNGGPNGSSSHHNSSYVPCRGDHSYGSTSGSRTMQVLTIFIFAFTCQQNIFSICDELKEPTMKRVGKVIGTAIGSAWVVYIIVAAAGFVTYGDLVQSDILNNYPASKAAAVARVAITLLVIFSYPLQLNPARKCVLSLIQSTTCGGYLPTPEGGRQTGMVHHYAITIGFLLLSLVIALAVTDLGVVLALVGATGSTMISYILPGACYYKLHPEWGWRKKVSIGLFCVGVIIVPIALFFIIKNGGGGH